MICFNQNSVQMILPLSPDDLDLSSSLEIDARVYASADHFLRLKDPMQRKQYAHFINCNQTLSSLFSLCRFVSMFCVPYACVLFANIADGDFKDSIGLLVVMALSNILLWRMYFIQKQISRDHHGSLPESSRTTLEYFHKFMFLLLEGLAIYRHLFRTIRGQCENPHLMFLLNKDCNPAHDYGMVVAETAIIIMLMPIIFTISVRGGYMDLTILLWVLTMATLIFSVIYSSSTNAILFLAYYVVASMVIFCDARRLSLFLFCSHQKLHEILIAKDKQVDEQTAEELRHMIANVAHDLKTVSASIIC